MRHGGANHTSKVHGKQVAAKKRTGIQETEFLGRFLDPGFAVLTVLGFALVIVAVVMLAPDPQDDGVWFFALFAAPTLPTLWSIFAGAKAEKEMGPRIGLAFGRLLGLPFLLSIPMALVGMFVVVLPPVAGQIAAVRAAGMHSAFPAENGPAVVMVLLLVGIVGGGAAMAAGLLAVVFGLIPWAAIRQPAALAAVAVFDERLFNAPQGKPIGRAFAVVMTGAFAIPMFLVLGAKNMQAATYVGAARNALDVIFQPDQFWGDAMWLAGVILVPVTVGATVTIWLKMRDLDAR